MPARNLFSPISRFAVPHAPSSCRPTKTASSTSSTGGRANWSGIPEPKIVYPSWAGGHSWPPMSFNPRTGLVYIPAIDVPSVWVDLRHNGGRIKFVDSFFTAIGVFPDETYHAAALKQTEPFRLRRAGKGREAGAGSPSGAMGKRAQRAWRLCEACLDVEAASIMLFE